MKRRLSGITVRWKVESHAQDSLASIGSAFPGENSMTSFNNRLTGRLLLLLVSLAFWGCDDGDAGADGMTGGMTGDGGSDITGGVMGGTMGGTPMGGSGGTPECSCDRELECNAANECVEVDPCERDTQCVEGNICTNGGCVPGCVADAECANADATTPLCVDGRCGACRADDDCFGASTCDADTRACAEPEMCTDSRECLDGNICVGSVCEAPFDCAGDDANCETGFICAASGECIPNPDGPCQTNDDCVVIGEVCRTDLRPPSCGPCEADEHCPGNQLCDGGACVESEECVDDNDCLGERLCAGGACTAGDCTDDEFEENDDAESAQGVIGGLVRGLVSCAGDADFYALELEADSAATVIVRQLDQNADLMLSALSSDGDVLDSSDTNQPTEALVLGPYPSAQTIHLLIQQSGSPGNAAYTLQIELVDAQECVDDRFDAGAGDDDFATGRRVRNEGEPAFEDDVNGRLCPGDVDYICFYLNRELFEASVNVLTGNPTITGELVDDRNEVLADATWSRDESPTLAFQANGATTYCLRLSSDELGGSYEVELNAFDRAVRDLCDEGESLSLEGGSGTVDQQLLDRRGDDAIRASCSPEADGAEKVYVITVDDPERVEAEGEAVCAQTPCLFPPLMLTAHLSGEPNGTFGDPAVSIRSQCTSAGAEVACSNGSVNPDEPYRPVFNPAVARTPITAPGEYSVIVDGSRIGNSPAYRLQVETGPLSSAPINDACNFAAALPFNDDGATEFNVSLDQAADDLFGCAELGGPDAVYRVEFARSSYVRIQTVAPSGGFAVGAYLTRACGEGEPEMCGFGFEGAVEAGEYFLVIDGADQNSRGRVAVQMVVEPFADAPVNETCETAVALNGAEGEVSGDTRSALDDYIMRDANQCTGHNTRGGDVVYALPVEVDQDIFVQAEPIGGWDLALYLVGDCADAPGSPAVCADSAITESLTYTADATGNVYVVVDGSNGEAGEFSLRWGLVECRLPVDCDSGVCTNYRCVAD